jgi:hypothetical protein
LHQAHAEKAARKVVVAGSSFVQLVVCFRFDEGGKQSIKSGSHNALGLFDIAPARDLADFQAGRIYWIWNSPQRQLRHRREGLWRYISSILAAGGDIQSLLFASTATHTNYIRPRLLEKSDELIHPLMLSPTPASHTTSPTK